MVRFRYVIENGRIALDGRATKLREYGDVEVFYMGLSELGERRSYREVKHYREKKRWLG